MSKPVRLFRTQPHNCSYLAEQQARNVVCDPALEPDRQTYNSLADSGFRRSGGYLYRPNCSTCKACVATRIPVNEFKPGRSMRRNWKRNRDLLVSSQPARFSAEHYALYQRYQSGRHAGGGMDDCTPETYMDFLTSPWSETRFHEFRLGGELLGIAATDEMSNGLSAVYTFFAPEHSDRGLGTYAILWQINEAKRQGMEWLYLGYWIGASAKMRYKTRFQPIELLQDGHWQRHQSELDHSR